MNPPPHPWSSARWERLWLTATRRAPPPAWFEQLTALYNEPHRHYHNALHIADCLAEFDRAHHLASNSVAVEFAIWFNDARYEPRASANEERSADLATDWLSRQGASDVLADAVRRLVLATKAHDTGVCPDAPLMVDVDLSILGAAPDRFWEYERQIRAEYAWVDDRVFAVKRALSGPAALCLAPVQPMRRLCPSYSRSHSPRRRRSAPPTT